MANSPSPGELLLSVPLKDSLSLAWRPASSLEEGAKGGGMSPKGSLLEGAGTRSVTEGVGHWVVTQAIYGFANPEHPLVSGLKKAIIECTLEECG